MQRTNGFMLFTTLRRTFIIFPFRFQISPALSQRWIREYIIFILGSYNIGLDPFATNYLNFQGNYIAELGEIIQILTRLYLILR